VPAGTHAACSGEMTVRLPATETVSTPETA